MAENSGWKRALKEPNAFGWIAFLILALGIGVGTLIFGDADFGRTQNAQIATPAPIGPK
jgi:hypothetical protein